MDAPSEDLLSGMRTRRGGWRRSRMTEIKKRPRPACGGAGAFLVECLLVSVPLPWIPGMEKTSILIEKRRAFGCRRLSGLVGGGGLIPHEQAAATPHQRLLRTAAGYSIIPPDPLAALDAPQGHSAEGLSETRRVQPPVFLPYGRRRRF